MMLRPARIFRLKTQKQTTNHPDFQYLEGLPSLRKTSETQSQIEGSVAESPEQTAWPKSGGRLYGSVVNFRGLQHAPINEQGVVFLFGMVALELGFIVESVATGFPDCESKRRVSRKQDLWERVRIEFEHQSRAFQTTDMIQVSAI